MIVGIMGIETIVLVFGVIIAIAVVVMVRKTTDQR